MHSKLVKHIYMKHAYVNGTVKDTIVPLHEGT
jgi:hypothetical protein